MNSPYSISDWWAVVPAAGVGRRMGGERPKQYLELNGRRVIDHTLSRLGSHPGLRGLVVVIGAEDGYWSEPQVPVALETVAGGEERCHSVLNGMEQLAGRAGDDDWVLVHDAVRPCLRAEDIDALLSELAGHPVGGLLGLPIADTVKRTDRRGDVLETVSREGLWRALTPQMFRFGLLRQALRAALEAGEWLTDEAAAIERAGYRPKMVEGHGDNIKITRPRDLALAALYLAQQEEV
ncbi:2-C-methyl-D-erythritol 4-phosphate cytidylyltransferase [Thiohalomonas denitrificans]|uniref:2-C-methyl-D-erythritol 4-phosphate cytidylyltransferase n=1 Tax=Thiohalomonas denitrificans TaxID=415747 RepID=UPI0026EA7C27|nr:2-C-methyl-D-erythritol 4-phosphate cytidylyltransferase [Thiohalomonas denitrificans]